MCSKHFSFFCKQGFRDTKAVFCLLRKFPNPHRTLPAASGCASAQDASMAVPAKEKSPVQDEHYAHTAPDIPSSTALSIFFFLPHFLLMQLLFFLFVLFQDFMPNLLIISAVRWAVASGIGSVVQFNRFFPQCLIQLF